MHGYTQNKNNYLIRLRRIEGQVRGLQRMVEDYKHCIDILTQVAAATKALQSIALGLLEEHLSHCVVDAVAEGGETATAKVHEASEAIARLVREPAAQVDFRQRVMTPTADSNRWHACGRSGDAITSGSSYAALKCSHSDLRRPHATATALAVRATTFSDRAATGYGSGGQGVGGTRRGRIIRVGPLARP